MCLDMHRTLNREKQEEEKKQTKAKCSVLWNKMLAIELEDVPAGQTSSSETAGDFTRRDDMQERLHHVCWPLSVRVCRAPFRTNSSF